MCLAQVVPPSIPSGASTSSSCPCPSLLSAKSLHLSLVWWRQGKREVLLFNALHLKAKELLPPLPVGAEARKEKDVAGNLMAVKSGS
jgi:hypothetical protein